MSNHNLLHPASDPPLELHRRNLSVKESLLQENSHMHDEMPEHDEEMGEDGEEGPSHDQLNEKESAEKESSDDDYRSDNEDDKREVDEILEARDQQKEGFLFQLIFCAFFMAHFVCEIRLEASTGINSVIDNLVTNTYFNRTTEQTVMNVSTIAEMEQSLGFLIKMLYQNTEYDPEQAQYMGGWNFTHENHDASVNNSSSSDSNNGSINGGSNSSNGSGISTSDSSTENNNQNQTQQLPPRKPPLFARLVQKYNYFMGMRITTINAKTTDSEDSEYKNVLPIRRDSLYNDPFSEIQDINTTMPPFKYQDTGGYRDEGGFVQFLKGNASLNETVAAFKYLIDNNFFRNNMVMTVVELMFYNSNQQLGNLVQLKFFRDNTGNLQVIKSALSFLPQNYDKLTDPYTVFKITMFSGFFTMLCYLFVNVLVLVITKIKDLIYRKGFVLHWYTCVDIIVVALCITSVTIWFLMFIQTKGNFIIPFNTQDDFNQWSVFAYQLKTYIQVSAVCVVLMSVRNLRVLTTQFPAFGVLFDTIRMAKVDLLFFFIFVLIIGMAATCVSIGFFGQHEERFANVRFALMTLFQMMMGKFYLSEMEQANQPVAMLYFIPFVLIFFFIVINFFSAIVMRTYDNLRQRKQIVTEAMAEIIAKDAQRQKQVWMNFFLCRMKQYKNEDEDFDSPNHSDKNFLSSSGRLLEIPNPGLIAKITYNLNQIRKHLSGANEYKTKEQFEHELSIAKRKILKKRRLEQKKRKNQFTDTSDPESYTKLKESLLYIIMLIVFVVMLLYQTNNHTSQNVSSPARELLTSQPFHQVKKSMIYDNNTDTHLSDSGIHASDQLTFYNMQSFDDALDFLRYVVFPFIYEFETLAQGANFPVSGNGMRLTFRFMKNDRNSDEKTNPIFMSKQVPISEQSSLSYTDSELTSDFITRVSNLTMNYSSSNDVFDTFNGEGGYQLYLSSDKSQASQLLQRVYDEDWMYYGVGQLVADFVLYNPNYQKFVYIYFLFSVDGTGSVTPTTFSTVKHLRINTLQTLILNHFTASQAFLLFLEMANSLFKIYYLFKLLKDLRVIWTQVSAQMDPRYDTDRGDAGKCQKIIQYLGLDYKKLKKHSPFIILLKLILGIIIFIIRVVIKILKVLWRQMTKDFYALTDLVTCTLSIWAIVIWTKIIVLDNFLTEDYSQVVINRASGLQSLQNEYRFLQHLNIFLTFLRILQFFTFSKKLSTFAEILGAAKYDIIFFVIMFAIIIVGYAIAGYALFGSSMTEFSTIFLASFELLRMLIGQYNYTEMYKVDSALAGMFFISYLVIFKIALLNMFIAIIVAHYNEFRREQSEEEQKVSFFRVILSILKNNMLKEDPKRSNWCLKVSKCCFNIPKLQNRLFGWMDQKQMQEEEEKEEQEIQASNMNKVLQRFPNPDYKENQLSYGMRPYLADNLLHIKSQSHMDKVRQNITIYKRIEEQGYNSYDQINSNFWVYYLEQYLQKMSQNKLSIYDLYSDEGGKYSQELESANPENLTTLQKRFLSIGKQETYERLRFIQDKIDTIHQKYEVWKALDFEKMIKIISQNPNDTGLQMFRMVNGLQGDSNRSNFEEDHTLGISFKYVVGSQLFSMKFNKVTKFQHYLWTQVFTVEDQHLLWFEIFTTLDRVRLWNRLVFSEIYFNFIGHNAKYKRDDIRYIMAKINNKVNEEIQKKTQLLKEKFPDKPKDHTLSHQECQRIRDKYYNSKVLVYVWNQLKKRTFEVPTKRSNQNSKKKVVSLNKKDYMEMLRSMFKLMIKGISNDRLKIINRMRAKNDGYDCNYEIYKKLKEEIFDDTEYRLSLWLPLSNEDKLDMIMHQRIEEEMEMMIFLFDEELEMNKNVYGLTQQIELQMERSFDQQIYEKYIQYARLQATKKSLELCLQRLNGVQTEDQQLIEYAGFLHQKMQDYDSLIYQLKLEVAKKKKHNEKRRAELEDHLKRKFMEEMEQNSVRRQNSIAGTGDNQSLRLRRFGGNNSIFSGKRSKKFPGAHSVRSGISGGQQHRSNRSIQERSDESGSQLSKSHRFSSEDEGSEDRKQADNSPKKSHIRNQLSLPRLDLIKKNSAVSQRQKLAQNTDITNHQNQDFKFGNNQLLKQINEVDSFNNTKDKERQSQKQINDFDQDW